MKKDSVKIDGRTIEISRPDKVLFPKSGITKGELIDYYLKVSKFALRELKKRPVTMERYPDGIEEQRVFQKQTPNYFPDWIERARLPSEDGRESVEYPVVNDAASLVYLANQACITPHIWLSRLKKPRNPDRLAFDLDPSDDDFGKVRQAAKIVKEALDDLALPSFVLSTGSRGLHVVVPLDRSASIEQTHDFARNLAFCLAERYPRLLTVEQQKAKRGSRVFVDYVRNSYGQTIVAPYAVRAREDAPVATPLEWHEALAAKFIPTKYTIRNLFRRLGQRKDPWIAIDRSAVSLSRALAEIENVSSRAA